MMKLCELCKRSARIHCEADQASLCWTCDAMVHSANFIVARHLRNLLCNVCQSPMPWSCSGAKLKITISVCEQCDVVGRRCDEINGVDEAHVAEDLTVTSPPPPSSESSSSGEESESDVVSRKRCRHLIEYSRNRHSDIDRRLSSISVRTRRRRCKKD